MSAKMKRTAYAEMFGPTTGDRVRLADTDIIIEVEKDLCTYGEEVKFGGGTRPPPSGPRWECGIHAGPSGVEGKITGASFAAKLRRGSTRTCLAAWSRCAH